MPRNGSGSMAVVNTFSPSTTISSSQMNANLSDIGDEITNSLALDGQSTMTGVLKLANGSASAPSWTFGSDTNSGGYRIGADNIGIAVNGAKVLDIATTGLSITGTLTPSGQIVGSAGSATAPSYSFVGDLNNGFYYVGTDNFAAAVGGSKVVDFLTTGITVTGLVTTDDLTVNDDLTVTDDVAIGGDVAVNTNKFTVAGASGNTAIAGTLVVTGATTLTGALTANNAAGITGKNTAKAFCKFTVSGGVVSYTAGTQGFNIASVVRTDTGDFTITFTSAMADTNYSVIASAQHDSGGRIATYHTLATGSFKITVGSTEGSADPDGVSIMVLGL